MTKCKCGQPVFREEVGSTRCYQCFWNCLLDPRNPEPRREELLQHLPSLRPIVDAIGDHQMAERRARIYERWGREAFHRSKSLLARGAEESCEKTLAEGEDMVTHGTNCMDRYKEQCRLADQKRDEVDRLVKEFLESSGRLDGATLAALGFGDDEVPQ